MPIKPRTPIDNEIFQIWSDLGPTDAFIAGYLDCAGRVFVPTQTNIQMVRKRIGAATLRCETASQRKLLACLDTYLSILEPSSVPGYVLDAFFAHLIKEGVKVAHLTSLAEYGKKALEAYFEGREGTTWPIGQRLLSIIRFDGLLEMLGVINSTAKSKLLKTRVSELTRTVKRYRKQVYVEGFSTGTFNEVWGIIRAHGCALNRQDIYGQALRDLYDYTESPIQVEEKGLGFLRNELGDYKRVVQEFADGLGCEARSEAVTQALRDKKSLKAKNILEYISGVRKVIVKIVNKRIVAVNPKYSTRVVETPRYLSGVLPSGAASSFDYLTTNPRQIFLVTTDPRRDPHTVPSELINLLIHEEYGHCVHASNSTRGYGAKPAFVEMLGSTLGNAVSEGMSFQREREFLDYLEGMDETDLTKDEKVFIRSCDRIGGFEVIRREYEFFTKTWRLTRFLRVIGDARINSGKQDLADFIEWANNETGLSRSRVYFQVFPAHQGIGPGYASTYAIVGEAIREIQKAAKDAGKSLVEFNTYASSQGYTPRTVFESRLWDQVRN